MGGLSSGTSGLFPEFLGSRGVPEKKTSDVQEFPEFLGMSRNSPTLAVFLENGEFLHFFRKTQEVGVFLKKVLGTEKKWFRTTFSLFLHPDTPDDPDHRKSRKK